MSYCQKCRRHYREPPDEQGDHPCPKCGLLPPKRILCPDTTSYDLAVVFVRAKIEAAASENCGVITVGDMRDCDCLPLTVHLTGGERWNFLGADTGDSGRLWATYERKI